MASLFVLQRVGYVARFDIAGGLVLNCTPTLPTSGYNTTAPHVNSIKAHLAALVKYQSTEGTEHMAHTTTASPWLDTEQAAAYLHLAPRTMNNMRALRHGPRYSKAGGRVLYHIDDLDRYIVRVDLKPEVN